MPSSRGSSQPRDRTQVSRIAGLAPFLYLPGKQCYTKREWSESESLSVVSDSLQPSGLYSPWNSPAQNTGVCSFSLFQGIFPTQGLNPGFPHCRRILYQLSHKGSRVKVAQSCLTLCNPMDCSLPGSSVYEILQARILEWVVVPFSGRSSQPRNQTQVSHIAGRFFTI